MAPQTSIYIGKKLMDELETRYRRGAITKNQYLIEKGKIQQRIDKGWAIKRTPFGYALKVFLVLLFLATGAALFYLIPGWLGWLAGGVQLASAIYTIYVP
jgi:hypothetical protein